MLLSTILSRLIISLSIIFSKKIKIDNEKISPFECGFSVITNARIPFSLRFFLIAIIFLIFDIEITIILPLIPTFKLSNLYLWTITSIIILMILVIGVYYEWIKGALNWN